VPCCIREDAGNKQQLGVRSMLFRITLGMPKNREGKATVNQREAVRAIVIRNGLLLMLKSNKGDMKFPGGGRKRGESHEKALIREVREETGFLVEKVKQRVGIVTERSADMFKKGALFEMISHYYLCEISQTPGKQELDDYEKALELHSCWVGIDEAIENNEHVLMRNHDINRWVQRETIVLRKLKSIIPVMDNKDI